MSVIQALEIIKKYYESNAFSVDETEAFLVLFEAAERRSPKE